MANRLAKIDPAMVDNLDELEAISIEVKAATQKGFKTPADIDKVNKYIDKVEAEIKEKKRLNLLGEFAELVNDGIIDKNASYEEILEIVNGIESNTNVSKKTVEEKKAEIKEKFDSQKEAAREALKESKTELAKAKIAEALDIDIDKLSISDAYKLVTAIDNFIENDIADDLGSLVSKYKGKLNASIAKAKGLKARSYNSFNRLMNNYFAPIPTLVDSQFAGVRRGSAVLKLSAYNALARGAALANRMTERIINDYSSKFDKTKPNGENFKSVQNIYERGLLANLLRSVDNDAKIQEDFNEKKELILQSVDKLLNSKSKKERAIGEAYQELIEKVGLENATNVSELNVDPINKNAVDFWIKEWQKHYDKLSEVSQVIYNTKLEADRNYTPVRFTRVEAAKKAEIADNIGMFAVEMGISNTKSGVLMESTRPTNIGDRYLDLDFDASNVRAVNSALLDIHTSDASTQMNSFINSSDFKDLFEKVEDYKMVADRFKNYANRARKKEAFEAGMSSEKIDKVLNMASAMGTARVLGGISQVPKQTISVLSNTLINAGPQNFVMITPWMSKSSMNQWLERSDLTITTRGMSARSSYEKADKILGGGGNTESKMRKLNDFYLETFLGKSDVYAARSSFMSYYIQSLRKQGVIDSKYATPNDFDWDNHEVNDEAADYAQHMVDRQQNVSDNAAAGEMFASNKGSAVLIRKTLLPFATFIMNQKARMVSDFRTIFNSEYEKGDKTTAYRSLFGAFTEVTLFAMMSEAIRSGYGSLADELSEAFGLGAPEGDDENKKKWRKESAFRQIIKDFLSPITALDKPVLAIMDKIVDKGQDLYDNILGKTESDEGFKDMIRRKEEESGEELTKTEIDHLKWKWREDKEYRVSDTFDDGDFGNLGVWGIAPEMYQAFMNTGGKLDGEIIKETPFGKKEKKFLTDNTTDVLLISLGLQLGHAMGVFPADVRSIQRKLQRTVDKSALTFNQNEEYIKLDKKVSNEEVMLIKKGFNADDIKDNRTYYKSLNEKQLQTYYDVVKKSPSKIYLDSEVISQIKKGMTAEKIVKYFNE
jgi:hypothetical protein